MAAMNDTPKTNEELLDEVASLRRRIAELEQALAVADREKPSLEAALRESAEKYRAVMDNIPDIVYSLDASGIVTDINGESLKAFATLPMKSSAVLCARHL